ncbi:MAG: nitrite reductase small subunit NirD [Alphaproteobacteria bacterium]|nr:nitrite reductase small subunit NirD [Alphaproteobacteria bacterium]
MRGENWVVVGRIEDIPQRGARRVKSPDPDLPIALFRTADDRVFALIDRCPHKGGPLSEGIVQGCAVACPLHGWVIDLETGAAAAPDEGAAPVIDVKLEDGVISLDLTPPRGWSSKPKAA